MGTISTLLTLIVPEFIIYFNFHVLAPVYAMIRNNNNIYRLLSYNIEFFSLEDEL